VDGKDVTVGSCDALEATNPNRLIVDKPFVGLKLWNGIIIDKLLVGLKLWNGMNTSAFTSECVVVVDSDHFASVGVDNIGTGNERYVGGAMLVIPFDVDGPCDRVGCQKITRILLPATPPLARRSTMSMPGLT
jgi:hypothetical protein